MISDIFLNEKGLDVWKGCLQICTAASEKEQWLQTKVKNLPHMSGQMHKKLSGNTVNLIFSSHQSAQLSDFKEQVSKCHLFSKRKIDFPPQKAS